MSWTQWIWDEPKTVYFFLTRFSIYSDVILCWELIYCLEGWSVALRSLTKVSRKQSPDFQTRCQVQLYELYTAQGCLLERWGSRKPALTPSTNHASDTGLHLLGRGTCFKFALRHMGQWPLWRGWVCMQPSCLIISRLVQHLPSSF